MLQRKAELSPSLSHQPPPAAKGKHSKSDNLSTSSGEAHHDSGRASTNETRNEAPVGIAITPAILSPPLHSGLPAPPAAGSNMERAQMAALAERVLTSFRMARREGRTEIRMRLAPQNAHDGAEVRLVEDAGEVSATVIGDGPSVDALVDALKAALGDTAVLVE